MGTWGCHAVVVQGWQSMAGLKRRCRAASRTWRDEKVGGHVLFHKRHFPQAARKLDRLVRQRLITGRQGRQTTLSPNVNSEESHCHQAGSGHLSVDCIISVEAFFALCTLSYQVAVHLCSSRTRNGVIRSWPIDRKA